MRTLVGIESLEPPPDGSAVTIGTFDGVHLGHRALIGRSAALAAEGGLIRTAVTWDRHPLQTLRPDKAPALLTSPERKIELLSETGLDVVAMVAFTKEFSLWPPERFVEEVLVAGLGARAVLVGEGWRFGHGAAGDTRLLGSLGERLGFETYPVSLEQSGGAAVSSSRIRSLVAEGDLEGARELLGRPFDLDGVVVRGDGRGKGLGYPTANLEVDVALARPPRGVYAGRARVKGTWYPAAVSVGVNPTFGGEPGISPVRIEAYLLDFSHDVYGSELRLELWKRLRDEERFESIESLVEQMGRDVEATRALTC